MNARKAQQPEKAQDYFEGFDKGYGSSPSSQGNPKKNLAINAGDSDSEDSADQQEDVVSTLLGTSPEKSQKIIYDLEKEGSSVSGGHKHRKVSLDMVNSNNSLAGDLDDAAEKMKEIGDGIMSETNISQADAEASFWKNMQQHQDQGN